jgi:hypothetical protein
MRELDTVVQDATAGDPISGLKWTHKSLRKISRALRVRYPLSAPTISRLLRLGRYSLRVNRKRLAGRQSPGRDEQFGYITRVRQAFLRQQRPVISVDTKKKELVGNFRNPGRVWGQEVREVNMYDFPGQANGKAVPYGVYDVGRNRGYVSVGRSHDTPEFAVAAIRAWWLAVGRHAYPEQRHLLIEADCGGSNGNRSSAWKVRLQALADEFGLHITVTHYPTGASKWNPIEHRMFNLISANWAGHPLESYETILKHIRTTRSAGGFRCRARVDTKVYPSPSSVSREDATHLRVRPHKLFPHWNYTLTPRPRTDYAK